jgi:4-amino-4-deoxy-L-arabinose transferase-like glycosyltransferase
LKTAFVLFSSTVMTPERIAPGEASQPDQHISSEEPKPRGTREERRAQRAMWAFRVCVGLGLILRLTFVAIPGRDALTFHSGGSDAPSYVLLAQNLLGHMGYGYAGQPSAVRPPGYPLLLASLMEIFGGNYISAVRGLQFILGLVTVAICAGAARRLFGDDAGRASLLVGLFLPTLIFTTAQVLTECLAALLTAIFLRNLIVQCERGDLRSAWGMGWSAGVESMVRFNAAALPLFAALAIVRRGEGRGAWRRVAMAVGVPLLVVAPWLIRNEIAFRGQVLYSTQSGPNAVQGVLTSEGRTQPGDSEILRSNLGWELHQIETNAPSRLALPSEAALHPRAWELGPGWWAREGWQVFALLVKKVSDFWLSTDQLAGTASLARGDRRIRFAGVLAYWLTLLLAAGGWWRLREIKPRIATVLLIYAAAFTALHLPLVMNTRLRIPLLEPLLVMLAGAGWCWMAERWSPEGVAEI